MAEEDIEAARKFTAGVGKIGTQLAEKERQMGIVDATPMGAFGRLVIALVAGWARPLMYRDAGERAVRKYFILIYLSSIFWLPLLIGGSIVLGMAGLRVVPGPILPVVIIWTVGLAIAERLAVRVRAKRGQYIFSRFIGFPRLGPTRYQLQVYLLMAVGAVLCVVSVDRAAGILFVGTGIASWLQLAAMEANRRRQALDQLDAEWLAHYQGQAAQEVSGADENESAVSNTPPLVSSADIVRWMSEP